jgi:hypothetical protein
VQIELSFSPAVACAASTLTVHMILNTFVENWCHGGTMRACADHKVSPPINSGLIGDVPIHGING